MSWTDERIETLKTLWAEGLSGSQIAFRMDGNVTRNAVIGKLHRLGLLGLAKRTKGWEANRHKARRCPRAPSHSADPSPALGKPPFKTDSYAHNGFNSKGLEALKHPSAVALVESPPLLDDPKPEDRIAVIDLKEWHCRWPIGVPGEAGFGHCGRSKTSGISYCETHARLAYR